MKNTFIIILVSFLTMNTQSAMAQKSKKTEEISVKTSAQCDMCKERLEKAMAYEKGVVSSNLNVETSVFVIKYKTAKTTPEKIKEAISNVGYDADDVKASQKAHDNLPKCCQKGGHK